MTPDLSVWAPTPSSVRLWIDGEVHDLTGADDGWWRPPPGLLPPDGARYGYLLDDESVVTPDPRSRWQPDGVHESSAVFDPTRFQWSDAGWPGRRLAGAVLYELHVSTFTSGGTLDDAILRLDHLADLGVDFVELLPVNAFNGTWNWGYDGVLWYAVDDTYGGPHAYQRFVDACHCRGLAVVQDVVYNHLGPSGNHLTKFGPYLHAEQATTWGDALDFRQRATRQYVVDNARMWFEDMHVDGLRLDAVHALVDHSDEHILQELSRMTERTAGSLGRPLTLIAESDLNDPVMITPRTAGGFGMDAQWSDDFHHAVHVAITGETSGYYADFASPEAIEKVMLGGFFHDGTWSSFRERYHGSRIDTASTPAWRLVVYSQNHDQVGNRATGDRTSATVSPRRLGIAAVLTLAGPFTPMIFMGEEWGTTTPWRFFTAHPEPDLAEATARGRIDEFARMGWDRSVVSDPQNPETFAESKLQWDERFLEPHRSLLELYRTLIEARRRHPALTDPAFPTSVRHGAGWFVIDRAGLASVVINLSDLDLFVTAAGRIVVATDPGITADHGQVWMPAESAAVLLYP